MQSILSHGHFAYGYRSAPLIRSHVGFGRFRGTCQTARHFLMSCPCNHGIVLESDDDQLIFNLSASADACLLYTTLRKSLDEWVDSEGIWPQEGLWIYNLHAHISNTLPSSCWASEWLDRPAHWLSQGASKICVRSVKNIRIRLSLNRGCNTTT